MSGSSQRHCSAYVDTPAKINLHLDVVGRRDDGFHDIDSFMVAVDWTDTVHLQVDGDADIRVDCRWDDNVSSLAEQLEVSVDDPILWLPQNDQNLVARVLRDFKNRFQVTHGLRCELTKRIPSGAGLGGASSDAAAALRLAAAMFGIAADDAPLMEIAAAAGSDIPFFLQMSIEHDAVKVCRATGRGTDLQPIHTDLLNDAACLIAYPAVSLSTAMVYQGVNVRDERSSQRAELLQRVLCDASPNPATGLKSLATLVRNDLAEPASLATPKIAQLLASLRGLEPIVAQMTGSGSACFALFDSTEAAIRGQRQLQNHVPSLRCRTHVARFVTIPPVMLSSD